MARGGYNRMISVQIQVLHSESFFLNPNPPLLRIQIQTPESNLSLVNLSRDPALVLEHA